ncbi:MAG: sphingosine kinase [Rhodospirillaceae bacterium]|nr:sphingosine kinase [Rhodospirillaceae bacterium]
MTVTYPSKIERDVARSSEGEDGKTTPRRVLVVRNPTAGRRRHGYYRAVLRVLEAMGCVVACRDTMQSGDAERIAAEIDGNDYDVIAIAGGDGTINEALNGLRADSPALAVIPLGTANVLALELGLPKNPAELATIIAEGRPMPIRLGRLNERRFVMMAGAGFDARVVAGVTTAFKRLAGKAAYVWRSIVELLRYQDVDYSVEVDGTSYHAASVVVANGRHYGGPFMIAPEADLCVDSFEVCLFERGGRFNAMRYGLGLITHRIHKMNGLKIVRGKSITILGPLAEPIQVDGDIFGQLPASITLDPDPVAILVPSRG